MNIIKKQTARFRSAVARASRRALDARPPLAAVGFTALLIAGTIGLLVSTWPQHRFGYASISAFLMALYLGLVSTGKAGDARSIVNPRGLFAGLGLMLGLIGMFEVNVTNVGSGLLTLVQSGLILAIAEMTEIRAAREGMKRDTAITLSAPIIQWLSVGCAGIMMTIDGVPIGPGPQDWPPEVWGFVLGALALFPPVGRHQSAEKADAA